jgi:uncharacterized protein YcbK (DUF882 family)
MDLSQFQCKCDICEQVQPDVALRIIIREIEKHFRQDIVITSGYRCESENKRVGGAPGSFHRKAMAVDFHIPGIANQDIYDWINNATFRCGLGIYRSHIHVDSRDAVARWDYR